MLTEMSQPAGGKGKEAMETARNTPYLRDVQCPSTDGRPYLLGFEKFLTGGRE